jgi:segregation and condensation protein A
MQDIYEIFESAEEKRENLLTVNLAEIVRKTLESFNNSTGYEIANKVFIMSVLVKFKSELLLMLFNLEDFSKNKHIKPLSEDPEVVEIFSALQKSFSTKNFERTNYFEINSVEEIPFVKLSRIVKEILEREKYFEHRTIEKNDISIVDVLEELKERIIRERSISFEELLQNLTTRIEIVINFLAVLILAKNKFIVIVQRDAFAPIYLEQHEEGRVPYRN